MINIAVDVMSGDHTPEELIAGAIQAVRDFDDLAITLYGDESIIQSAIAEDTTGRLLIHPTDEIIDFEDKPIEAVRTKTDSSMIQAIESVKEHVNDVVISPGNTGAFLAASIKLIGRIPGVKRPGGALILSTLNPDVPQALLMDVGGNVDLSPEILVTFAHLGQIYCRAAMGVANPRVGLINNGEEPGKGNKQTKKAYELLSNERDINFIGNIEPNYILTGACDVYVSDGFVGNMVLKTMEGAIGQVRKLLLETELAQTSPVLQALIHQMDQTLKINAVLIGLNAPAIVTHGNARADDIYHAIKMGRSAVVNRLIETANEHFSHQIEQ